MENPDNTQDNIAAPSYDKKAYNLEVAILNAIARFNVINIGLGIKKSFGSTSNPFEDPEIRTQEITRILSEISNRANLGLYGVNPLDLSESIRNATNAQLSSARQNIQ